MPDLLSAREARRGFGHVAIPRGHNYGSGQCPTSLIHEFWPEWRCTWILWLVLLEVIRPKWQIETYLEIFQRNVVKTFTLLSLSLLKLIMLAKPSCERVADLYSNFWLCSRRQIVKLSSLLNLALKGWVICIGIFICGWGGPFLAIC